jgi:hypothetical protein
MRCRTFACGLVVAVMAAVAASSAAARAAETPSALLEKGIYTEETVGDLDAATKLYKQAVAEAKKVEAVAAKAQYRLGLCLLKQGKKKEGIAALEQVVRQYPGQKEIVAAARKHFPATPGLKLLPPMWGQGESLHYRIKLGGGMEVGAVVYSVVEAKLDGKKIWRFHSETLAGGNHLASRVDANFDTFMPIDSSWLIGGVENKCQYQRGKVILKTVAAGGEASKTIEVDGAPYDNEEGLFVFRCLPMADGYKTTVPIFTSFGATTININFEVTGKETVEVPAGKFRCFRVLLRMLPANQTFWFSDDEHRYPVKIEANGVVIPLVKIEHLKPGESTKYSDAEFALALPPGWSVYRPKASGQGQKTDAEEAFLLVPNVDWEVHIKTTKLEKLSAEAKQSPRAWAEQELPKADKEFKGLTIRDDSWKSITVSGQSAVAYVADFNAVDGRPMSQYVVRFFGKTMAATLIVNCPRANLDRATKAIQPVVESLELK